MDKHVKPRDDNQAVPVQDREITTPYATNLVTNVHRIAFTKALIYLVVLAQLSFNFVTGLVFLEFLKVIYPKVDSVLPTAGNTIRSYIIEAYNEHKAKKKAELQVVKGMIHFSFDLWTSPNHLALLGLVAHWIDQYGQNQSVSFPCEFSSRESQIRHFKNSQPHIN